MRRIMTCLVPVGATALLAITAPSWAEGTGGPGSLDPDHSDIVMPMQPRLDELGHRMHITSDQQPAWDNFVAATRALYQGRGSRDASNADVQVRADRMTQFDAATDSLKSTLTDSQLQILDRELGDLRVHGA